MLWTEPVLRRLFVDAGLILAAWTTLCAVELLEAIVAHRALFAGAWEMRAALTHVTALLVAAMVPCAIGAAVLGALAERSEARGPRAIVAGVFASAGALVALGVSTGRHMTSWSVRAPFVAVVAIAAGAFAWIAAPRVVRVAQRAPTKIALAGLGVAAMAWACDALVLPRLYPAFHLGLLGVAACAGALGALVAAKWSDATRARIAVCALAAAVGAAAWGPSAARGLASMDNLRVVLTEQTPWLARGVAIATRIAPPPAFDDESVVTTTAAVARSLEWTGRDVVLLSVDALRADHVSSYGYARKTTPEIDALAKQGASFDDAYCATPHTSYSVTSMMTGKYMRPLLALGLGADSETWAADLRRYGYRTAAFYPPAVFFVDEQRFADFRDRGLDFEYRKVQFSEPLARAKEVERYLDRAPSDRPMFLWVHFFEPHEPYVMHDAHRFGEASAPRDVDAYDSEIAAADEGIGAVVRAVRARRKNPVFIVTADHGEEFGEHGGRYHGTTVYAEQVHVPLVIVADGIAPRRIATPVQTIDLLPTVLSALGIPRPPRVRGADLGPLLAGKNAGAAGFAFAETDEYARVVRGSDRLVCSRAAGACRLFDGANDPAEATDRARERPEVLRDMKKLLAAVERDHGRFERGDGADLPEALRRGLQGDVEAAPEVVALLDDAKVDIRRQAAMIAFRLHVASTAPQLSRALAKDEDAIVRKWCALALARAGQAPTSSLDDLDHDADVAWRRRAALVRAERGEASAESELVAWWSAEGPPHAGLEFDAARELLAALAKIRARTAAPVLVAALEDVRLRPYVVDALGAIGNPAAKNALLATFTNERYVHLRAPEANALLALGAKDEIGAPLARFAGVPDAMPGVSSIASRAGLLTAERGGWLAPRATGATPADLRLRVAAAPRGARLFVWSEGGAAVTGSIGGAPVRLEASADAGAELERFVDLPASTATAPVPVSLRVEGGQGGLRGLWIVARAEEIEPPPPIPWDAGADDDAGL